MEDEAGHGDDQAGNDGDRKEMTRMTPATRLLQESLRQSRIKDEDSIELSALNPQNSGKRTRGKGTRQRGPSDKTKLLMRAILEDYPRLTAGQIANKCGVSRDTIDTRIWRMRKEGLLNV